jgi:cathepsin A (carboxypeptidase C)
MRLATSIALVGAASAALAAEQHVLGGDKLPTPAAEAPSSKAQGVWASVQESFENMGADAKALWDEVTLLAPDAVQAFKKIAFSQKPKPATRKPDSTWDYIVKGADVQDMWVEKEGQRQRMVGGRLDSYNLRAKKVDPAKLQVDKVKQYSGYLDDNENDKHLFYCKLMLRGYRPLSWRAVLTSLVHRVLRVAK